MPIAYDSTSPLSFSVCSSSIFLLVATSISLLRDGLEILLTTVAAESQGRVAVGQRKVYAKLDRGIERPDATDGQEHDP